MREIIVEATSLEKAADYLNRYADKLDKQSANIVAAMLQSGEEEAADNLGHVDTGETLSTLASYQNGNEGTIQIGGNAIWIEFGTGMVANQGQDEHPMKEALGLSPWGTYGEGHGSDEDGWFYPGDDGYYHHTYGIPANYFFYNTAQMLRRQYAKIAKEVFK